MPPMVIFKASKILPEYREAAPSGYVLRSNPTGYISAELFADYGKLFVKFLKEKNIIGPNKIALLLDSHKSHMYNLDFMECMKKINIEVCCSPSPHTTNMLQPLDDLPFATLKSKWQQKLLDFNYRLRGRKMTKVEFIKNLNPEYDS